MPNNYRPVVVTIYKKKNDARETEEELILELPTDKTPLPVVSTYPEKNGYQRGVQVVNLYGDEKI